MDERQLLFQGVLTLVLNQERERESHCAFIYLPCPAFLSHELKASLCPAPPSWRAFSFPAADEKRWHAFLPFPASLLLEGGGCVGVFGEVRTVPSGHALHSAPIQTQGFKSYFPGMPRPSSQEMKRSSVFEGQPLSVLLFGSAVARLHFEVWEVKITGMALCHSIGPFTSGGKSKSLQLGPTHLLPSVEPFPFPKNQRRWLEVLRGRTNIVLKNWRKCSSVLCLPVNVVISWIGAVCSQLKTTCMCRNWWVH